MAILHHLGCRGWEGREWMGVEEEGNVGKFQNQESMIEIVYLIFNKH